MQHRGASRRLVLLRDPRDIADAPYGVGRCLAWCHATAALGLHTHRRLYLALPTPPRAQGTGKVNICWLRSSKPGSKGLLISCLVHGPRPNSPVYQRTCATARTLSTLASLVVVMRDTFSPGQVSVFVRCAIHRGVSCANQTLGTTVAFEAGLSPGKRRACVPSGCCGITWQRSLGDDRGVLSQFGGTRRRPGELEEPLLLLYTFLRTKEKNFSELRQPRVLLQVRWPVEGCGAPCRSFGT